jgi:CRP-like cAMP-binding protein
VVTNGAVAMASTPSAGRAAVLAILGPGDALGPGPERPRVRAATAAEEPPHVDLRAVVHSEVVVVPSASLRLACARDSSAAHELVLLAARQADVLSRRLELALTVPVADRLHRTLRDLAATFGVRRRGGLGVEIGLPLTQDLLAALVGATRESVNRALRVLGERGQVARREGRYVLPGPS